MKITQSHALYWVQKRAPLFIRSRDKAHPVSIHALIPSGETAAQRETTMSAGNLLALLHGVRRRGFQGLSLTEFLALMVENPGTVIRPKRRSGYAKKWLRRINKDKRNRKFSVTYRGFMADHVRYFPTRARAEQWARQAGVFSFAVITDKPKDLTQ